MIPLPLLKQRAIEVTLDFANLVPIGSVDAVHGLFMPLAALGGGKVFQTLDEASSGVAAYERDQAELVRWLTGLTASKLTARQLDLVQKEIGKRIRDTVVGRLEWRFKDGIVDEVVQPMLDGVQSCYSFGAMLLADERDREWRHLRRCKLRVCKRWFWDGERSGPPRKYCSDTHASRDRKARYDKGRKRRRYRYVDS
jgi:hypothetical protein